MFFSLAFGQSFNPFALRKTKQNRVIINGKKYVQAWIKTL